MCVCAGALKFLFAELHLPECMWQIFACIFSGRLFDHHILDMVELGVENFKSYHEFKVGERCM